MKFHFSVNFFHFSAGPDPGYSLNEQNDLDSDEEAQCVDFVIHTDDEGSLASKRLPISPFIMRLRRLEILMKVMTLKSQCPL